MMRPTHLLVLALALAAPLASAQTPSNPTLTVLLDQAEHTANGTYTLRGIVRYTSEVRPLESVTIDLAILEAPAYATVVVTPATLVIATDMAPDVGYDRAEPFEVTVTLHRDAPHGEVAKIGIGAMAHGQTLVAAAEGRAEQAFQVENPPAVDLAAHEGGLDTQADDVKRLPVPGAGALGAAVAMGAAGVALRRRR